MNNMYKVAAYMAATGMHKAAGIYGDIAKTIPEQTLTLGLTSGLGPQAIGTWHGQLTDNPEANDGKEWKKWMPGFAESGIMQKRQLLSRKHGNPSSQATAISENLGLSTSMLAPLILGAGIGAAAGAFNGTAGDGALIGGAIGGGLGLLGNLIGMGAAGVTKTRTNEEQAEYEQNPNIAANYIIPGRGVYNQLKAFGRIHADEQEHNEQHV